MMPSRFVEDAAVIRGAPFLKQVGQKPSRR